MDDILKWLKEKPLVIWGGGYNGNVVCELLTDLGVEIKFFVDTYAPKGGKLACATHKTAYDLVSPDALKDGDRNPYHILVSPTRYREIVDSLIAMGFEREKDFKVFTEVATYGAINEAICNNRISPQNICNPKVFSAVEIETINSCNNNCSFCPVSKGNDSRIKAYMEDELFEKIIEQLVNIDYSGEICLFSNNEPLLDSRIVERVAYAKSKLPRAYHYLFTNGILLTVDIFTRLMEHLDHLMIDNYSNDLQPIPTVQRIKDYSEDHPELKDKTTIALRLKDEVLQTRAGQAPNREVYTAPAHMCALPFTQLVIRPDGKVSLCCNDAYGRYTLGDINKQSLMEIWSGEKYRDVREKLLSNGRPGLDLCKNCDCYKNTGYRGNLL